MSQKLQIRLNANCTRIILYILYVVLAIWVYVRNVFKTQQKFHWRMFLGIGFLENVQKFQDCPEQIIYFFHVDILENVIEIY